MEQNKEREEKKLAAQVFVPREFPVEKLFERIRKSEFKNPFVNVQETPKRYFTGNDDDLTVNMIIRSSKSKPERARLLDVMYEFMKNARDEIMEEM